MRQVSDSKLAEEMLLDFLDSVESGIAAARQRFKQRQGINEPKKGPSTPEISEQPFNALFYKHGRSDKGPFEAARQPQNNNQNFQRCLNILNQNINEKNHTFSEKSWEHYYWLSDQKNAIFRRKKKPP
jgi:hypothetical protein